MERNEELWGRAQAHARRFLRRFDDTFTRAECEDLVQESSLAAWRWAAAVREPERFAAAVRTIARRKRYRALREHHRRREESAARSQPVSTAPATEFVVAGRRVPHDWLMPRIAAALRRLRPVDRRILRSQQEGFYSTEIAARLGLTEEVVKVRLHRARRRLRRQIESAVKVAGAFDGS